MHLLPNSLGKNTDPNGNKFGDGSIQMSNPAVVNDGPNPITYHGYSAALENLNTVGGIGGTAGGSYIQNFSTPPSNYCSVNGINNRVAGTDSAAIQEMMDSVQANVGSEDDMRYYFTKIATWHLADPTLVPALESYVNGLWAYNLPAYNNLGQAIMAHYRSNGNDSAALIINSSLQANNPTDSEMQNYCTYFSITGRMGTEGRPGFAPDSADLANLALVAGAGAGISPTACRLLKFYVPGAACTDAEADSLQNRLGFAEQPWLGQSYPNPALDQTTIPYLLPENTSAAHIKLHELVTGRLVSTIALPTRAGNAEATVELSNLPSGFFTYTLHINGQPVATKKMVVIK